MAIVSAEGCWVEVNQALCNVFGYKAHELIGQPVHAMSHPDDVPLTFDLLDRMRAGGEDVVEVEKRYLHADGKVMDVVVNTALMRDAKGHAEYFITQLRDVTAQRCDYTGAPLVHGWRRSLACRSTLLAFGN